MLVLSRKKNESIMIGDNIEIKVISVDGDTVRIGIVAPRDIQVHRKEIFIEILEENRLASQSKGNLTMLTQMLSKEAAEYDKKSKK
ncbi:carbon storage regulator [Brevibacillus fluminis]|uniref:Translational regulator CsrA n=1 Tax=Brevibacillus fluminis TaxID=511487 RepID=A0A3M8DXI8_9BACL|nr:carbon storage regulator CsrA [Brevibacillus fluminis]RNB92644.1 carbon storage regulator [Brevibacillus fluminis]